MAVAYIEYCNFAKGTKWSELRRSHGYDQPHKVKYWCLGNEMDGRAPAARCRAPCGRFLASNLDMERQILEITAVADYVQGLYRSPKQLWLSFDEWNVRYRARSQEHLDGNGDSRRSCSKRSTTSRMRC